MDEWETLVPGVAIVITDRACETGPSTLVSLVVVGAADKVCDFVLLSVLAAWAADDSQFRASPQAVTQAISQEQM